MERESFYLNEHFDNWNDSLRIHVEEIKSYLLSNNNTKQFSIERSIGFIAPYKINYDSKVEPNGTATYIIKINGGAKDTN